MLRRKYIALAATAATLALTGCSDSPDATLDEAIDAAAEWRDGDFEELVIQPRLGNSSEIIELEPGAGEWWVYLRCLGDEARIALTIDGVTDVEEQNCGEGMVGSAHTAGEGDVVNLGIEADSDTYWVLMVERRNG